MLNQMCINYIHRIEDRSTLQARKSPKVQTHPWAPREWGKPLPLLLAFLSTLA